MLASAIGCTGADEQRGGPDPGSPLLVADPDIAAAPTVLSFELDIAFDPYGLGVGDFDGDGNDDILVSGIAAGTGVTAAVYLGDGIGGFADPIDPGFGGCSAFPIVGDMNTDGRADVVTLGCGGFLSVYAGQTDGTFAPWSDWHEYRYGPVSSNAVVDFEGDGDADLISLHEEDSAFLELTLGNGGHGIWGVSTSEIGNPETSDFDPAGLIAGHFDNDGLVDVALLQRDYDVVTLRGTAPANFAFPRELGVSVAPWSIRPGDLDGDGLTDIVVSSYDDQELQVLMADPGSNGFAHQGPTNLPSMSPYDTVVADITGDGNPDVATVSDTDAVLMWLPGDGTGQFVQRRRLALPSPAIRVLAGEFDGDGTADLVAATFDDDSLTLVLSSDV